MSAFTPPFPPPTDAPVPSWAVEVDDWSEAFDSGRVWTRQCRLPLADGVELFAVQQYNGETVTVTTPGGVALDVDTSDALEGPEAITAFVQDTVEALQRAVEAIR